MTPTLGRGVGPTNARIMIVGEAWGEWEERERTPFVGASGDELTKMLAEVGIARGDCFITNVVNARPPNNNLTLWLTDKKKNAKRDGCTNFRDGFYYNDLLLEGLRALEANITAIKPNIIIALGNTPLWALLGQEGITSWRGSVCWSDRYGVKVCPTLHPAYILRAWEWRHIVLHDLRRFLPEAATSTYSPPNYRFTLRPTIETALEKLRWLREQCDLGPTKLSVDIETRVGHITCLGIAWSNLDAICLPFMWRDRADGYWLLEDEQKVVLAIRDLLLHPNARIVGQNFLYDSQYLAKHWGFVPRVEMDTMLAHHVHYLGMPKSLDFLSSLYCDFHIFWKNEGKEQDVKIPEERGWAYNCKDAVITYEVSTALEAQTDRLGLRDQVAFQMSLFNPVLRMMLRGVRFNDTLASEMALSVMGYISEREQLIEKIVGAPLNPNSPKQMMDYFYGVLNLPRQFKKVGKGERRVTLDDDALKQLAEIEPLVRRLVYAISECRSLRNSLSVIMKRRDSDGRARCSYNIAGTETTRFSSSENAFDNGGNLQNITAGGVSEETGLVLPNLRCLYLPDYGKVWVDVDLARADAQVVAWDAHDETLKAIFRSNDNLHLTNARTIWGDRVQKDSPEYKLAKQFCHAANYGAKPRRLAQTLGLTVHQAEQIYTKWFQAHPAIADWHRRIESQLQTTRQIRNAFGYRRLFLGRIDAALPEALAWIPQSTVAIVINHALVAIDKNCPDVELLLQVHDSLDFQIPVNDIDSTLERLKPHLSIVVPYSDPLIIPVGFKMSSISWGDAK